MVPSSKEVSAAALKVLFCLLKRFVIVFRHRRHRLEERKQINLPLCAFLLSSSLFKLLLKSSAHFHYVCCFLSLKFRDKFFFLVFAL